MPDILNLNPFGLFLEASSPIGKTHASAMRERAASSPAYAEALKETSRSSLTTLYEKAEAMVDEACGCECETCKPDPKDYEE